MQSILSNSVLHISQKEYYIHQRVLHKIRPTYFQSILSTLRSMTSISYKLFLMRLTENKMRQMVDTDFKCFEVLP